MKRDTAGAPDADPTHSGTSNSKDSTKRYVMSQRNPTISKGVDWSLVWIWFILSFIGITSIFAASWHEGDNIVQGFISLKTDYSRQTALLCHRRYHWHLYPADR